MASGSIEGDERFANMIHRQQWQQKQEMNELVEAQSVSTAHAEFRRGLEELVRDHFHTCMTLASCSSSHESGINGHRDCIDVHHFDEDHDDGEEEEGDQLIRRRRRSNIEEDLAESSAARRRQSRILTRWAAQQAQEMIRTRRFTLIVVAAAMLVLAFLGLLFSILGLKTLVYFLVLGAWFLVAGTFILCGVFVLLNSSLACGHMFGMSCIRKWLQRHVNNIGKCPQCNNKAELDDIRILYAPVIAVTAQQ